MEQASKKIKLPANRMSQNPIKADFTPIREVAITKPNLTVSTRNLSPDMGK